MGKIIQSVDISAKMEPFTRPSPFKIVYGGRDATKSWGIAYLLLIFALQRKIRILCGREYQRSLKDSVHKLLSDRITGLGMDARFEVGKTEIESDIGSTIIFAGFHAQTIAGMMSYEGIDICWVEQAERVTEASANVLIPTVLRNPGAEIWVSMNPDQKSDYFYHRFIENHDPDAVVVKMSYQDNKWFTPQMDVERSKMKALNDDLYRHIWLGECRSDAGLIFKRKWFRFYDTLPENLNLYLSSDYAVTPPDELNPSPDWTEHGVFGLDERGDLYIPDWWSGQTEPAEWIEAAMDLMDEWPIKVWFDETGVIRRSVDGEIKRAMRKRGIHVYREGITSAGSKAERALGFAARASLGGVYLPHTEWAERFVNQLCAFTGQDGRTDDMVDAASLVSRGIDKMSEPLRVVRPAPPPPPFSERWFDERDRVQPQRDRVYL